MSEYGKLWAQCEEIRTRLKSLSPFIRTNTMAEAFDSSAALIRAMTQLLEEWKTLEERMAREPE